MFSRQITMQINKNWTSEFPKVFEKEFSLAPQAEGFSRRADPACSQQDGSCSH